MAQFLSTTIMDEKIGELMVEWMRIWYLIVYRVAVALKKNIFKCYHIQKFLNFYNSFSFGSNWLKGLAVEVVRKDQLFYSRV